MKKGNREGTMVVRHKFIPSLAAWTAVLASKINTHNATPENTIVNLFFAAPIVGSPP
jgi:hypothetical protein